MESNSYPNTWRYFLISPKSKTNICLPHISHANESTGGKDFEQISIPINDTVAL